MASVYSSFLQNPSAAQLAPDASLNYITTTTVISEPAAILKHLLSNAKQVEKKGLKVLASLESPDGLCLETETTLLFKNGGGVYLPGIDDNLLDEKRVVFPMTHIVRFTPDHKIKQIRLYWDQGTLLRQVEVIGRTGRNWPIRDGKAQIDAITRSVSSAGPSQAAPSGAEHHRKQASVTATKDPHASLNLFAPRNPDEEPAPRAYDNVLSPRESAKPAPRDYGELFASEDTVPKSAVGLRSPSPSKANTTGQTKFTRNRLHDENAPPDVLSPGGAKKVYEQKYDHFSFGDGEDAPAPKPADLNRHSKHQSTFSFEDFATSAKHETKHKPDQERHWGADFNNENPVKKSTGAGKPDQTRHWGGVDDPPSPPRRNLVHAPRPDAKSHFDITDQSDEKLPVGTTTTNVDNSRRANDFGPHYEISDDSPANAGPKAKLGSAPRVDQEQHWGFGTPVQQKKIYKTAGTGMGHKKGGPALDLFSGQDEPADTKKIYVTQGDGMGGRKGGERAWYDYEGEEDDEPAAPARRGRGGRRQPGEVEF